MSVFLRTFVAAKRLWAGSGYGISDMGYGIWAIGDEAARRTIAELVALAGLVSRKAKGGKQYINTIYNGRR